MVNQWEDPNPELRWFECSIDQLATLRHRALHELGESTAVVNGLIGWIVGADATVGSTATRAAYRAILRTVGPPPPTRGRRARTSAGDRGAARLQLVAVGAATAGAALLAPLSPSAAAVSAAVVPIILGESSYVERPQTATQEPSCDRLAA